MRNKATLAATLVLPLLLLACNRADNSPTAAAPSQQEKQAQTPSAQDRMLESAPPAAGLPSPSNKPSDEALPPSQQGETRKGY